MPDGGQRSLSSQTLCNQTTEALVSIAAELSKEPELRATPVGGAAKIEDIQAIRHNGEAAFETHPERVAGQPGHVSIRFAPALRSLLERDQRNLRDTLLRKFGRVAEISVVRATHCE